MFVLLRVLCVAIMVMLSGCSTDMVKRTSYETLQNIRQQECLKIPSPDCEQRDSYDAYQRKLKKLE